ncbi:MAG: hypothetical protein ACJ76J_09890 [Thermoanaerobaculia bacterium]
MEQTMSVRVMSMGEGPVRMNLKPERVQQLLLGVPGWKLLAEGRGLETVRKFTSPGAASAFAAQACRLATLRRQPVKVRLWGEDVVITLHGHRSRGCVGGVTEKVFELAGLIGA